MLRLGVNVLERQVLDYEFDLGWIGFENLLYLRFIFRGEGAFEVDEFDDGHLSVGRAAGGRVPRRTRIPLSLHHLVEPGVVLSHDKRHGGNKHESDRQQQFVFHLVQSLSLRGDQRAAALRARSSERRCSIESPQYAGNRGQVHHDSGNRYDRSLESPEPSRGPNLSEEASQMLPLIYGELRRLAHSYLRRERSDHTLQPTALVHEAYVRLAAQHNLDWENRVQVMAMAASMMRRVLLDYANAHKAAKRSGSAVRMPFSEGLAQASNPVEFLDLNSALDDLGQLDERQARVVEMRFFGGMSVVEIAAVAGLSTATVERELRTARLWLMRRLSNG